MKLISMTDFALEQSKCNNDYQFSKKVVRYAYFLRQVLKEWMFDKNDKRCLFESQKDYHLGTILLFKKTIEDIANFDFYLTPTALKQIGL